MAGAWQQHHVFDGTYTFSDLVDYHIMAAIKAENQRRYDTWRKLHQEE